MRINERSYLVEKQKTLEIHHVSWLIFSLWCGIIYGYNVSIAAQIEVISKEWSLTTWEKERLSASATISDTLAMCFGGFLADRWGRRCSAQLAAFLSILGSLVSTLSYNFSSLLVARLIVGMGNGLCLLILPIYISESVSTSNRGILIAFFQIGVVAGCSFPYVVLLLVQNWQSTFAIGAIPGIVLQLAFLLKFHETPIWVQRKQPKVINPTPTGTGTTTLRSRMRNYFSGNGSSTFITPDRVTTPETTSESPEEQPPPTTTSSLSCEKSLVFVGIVLAYVNNSIDVCLFYGPTIIMGIGNNEKNALIFGFLTNISNVGFIALGAILLTYYFRRNLMLFCLAIVALCYFAGAMIFWMHGKEQNFFIAVTFIVFLCAYQCGPGTLFVLILSELFADEKCRGKQVSLCTFANSLFSLMINGTILTLIETLGIETTFFVYGCSYVLSWIFLYWLLPETKYKAISYLSH